MIKNRALKGLLGLCVGLIVLLPACGGRRPFTSDTFSTASAHYVSEQEGVEIRVRKLLKNESKNLFRGRGGFLFRKSRKQKTPLAQAFALRIKNGGRETVTVSRDSLSVATLGSQQVYDAVSLDPASRGVASGVLGSVLFPNPALGLLLIPGFLASPFIFPMLGGAVLVGSLLPGAAIGIGIGFHAKALNERIEDEIADYLLDKPIQIKPGKSAHMIVAVDSPTADKFELALTDLSSEKLNRTFLVDTCMHEQKQVTT